MAPRARSCIAFGRLRHGALLRAAIAALVAVCTVSTSRLANAFDIQVGEGQIEIHGYVEQQVRAIAADYSASDGWDLSQWYNVLAIETDLNLFPDGIGPFDLVSGFVRLEARFDCIWYRGCGMFPAVNAWGDNAEKFPDRNSNARKSGFTGSLFTGDTRPIHSIRVDQLGFENKDQPVGGRNTPAFLWHVPGVDTLFGVAGRDGVVGTNDDPAFLTFGRFVRPGHEYRFGLRHTKGQPNGNGLQVLGPFLPENKISPIGALRDVANPFNPLDLGPSSGEFGSTALPFRPAPLFPAGNPAPGNREEAARGLFIPNEAVAKLIRKKEFDDFDQNFSQGELAWNKGASQQDERELKEAYLDLEMFDSRLWLRLGKQNIVWGKTELFRTTDQFNPQDLALATLASLEETRIALWAARGVYSFYTVGPLDDVRLELAFNFDDMEPTDLGRCGEPYTPNPVCDKAAALFAHGLVGSVLAGEIRPPDPWDDISGLEFGARLEFRWNRFSFALSDFYGYDDFPYLDPVFHYSRNVDPRTGRPRRGQSRAACDPASGNTDGCLSPEDALEHHHANQQRFAVICSSSVGFSSLDRSACAQSVFNSNRSALTGVPDVPPSIPTVLGQVFSGSNAGATIVRNFFVPGLIGLAPKQAVPIVQLNADPGDGGGPANSLSAVFTDQQEALLGCGAFYGTSCDNSSSAAFGGLDLLNAELSALMQSWPGFPGTSGSFWNSSTGPSGQIQPGTIRNCGANPGAPGCGPSAGWVPFQGGAVATRFEDGRAYVLPGARSPFPEATQLRLGDVAWDASVDGCVSGVLGHPGCAGPKQELIRPWHDGAQWQFASGDYFLSEMAAFSWNYLLTLIAFSRNDPPGGIKPEVPCAPGQDPSTCREINELIADPVLALRTDGCSYARPELCSNVQALFSIAHTTRRSVRAGGTGDFGRVDSDWHQGGVGVLRYEKRNVLGFSMDFAEDVTKSNWGVETTWIQGNPFEDRDEFDGLRRSDTYNLTVSVDRPTFINFLNRGRTFFFNTQWFFQYIQGYHGSYVSNGPFNVLATFRVDTGYFRDRLLPGLTLVYDFNSNSGAILPEIAYRFTENLSVTLSMALFAGRFEPIKPAIRPIADNPYRAGRWQNVDWTEQGLSPVRDNDEVAFRLRYTF